jgi:predicted AAA+ superfamily ATPase
MIKVLGTMVERVALMEALARAVRRSPVTALLGPRQCGKTTLARAFARGHPDATILDLEDPAVLGSLAQPKTVLGAAAGLVVVDEIQRRPDFFPILRVLADREPNPARFLLLGSAAPELLRQASESLAGRIEFLEMHGFGLDEIGVVHQTALWRRGGFPRSFLAHDEEDSLTWREEFLRTFLERDLPQMGVDAPALMLRRFWTMVAHHHGQTWNSSEIAGSLGISDVTARRYLDLLSGAYMVRQLPPWFENLGKRQRRAPKAYVRDSGLLHALLGLRDQPALFSHPKCGASFEGFALEQVLRRFPRAEAYYWAVHGGPELDLLVIDRGERLGFEFKFADAPTLTRSMASARSDLKLGSLRVVYPGDRAYPLAPGIEAVPIAKLDASAPADP